MSSGCPTAPEKPSSLGINATYSPRADCRDLPIVRCGVLLGWASLVLAGCLGSGQYPVKGRVVDKQGQPIPELEGWQIVFSLEEGITSSEGELRADGTFEAFTFRPRDGVPPGQYRVYIPRRYLDPERAAPPVLDPMFEHPETSPLRATVEPKRNYFEFQVERIRLGRR